MASSSPPVSELQAWGAGDQSALDRLVPIVYEEPGRLARQQDRTHFLANAARLLRGSE